MKKLLLLLLALNGLSSNFAQSYFVSLSGNDTNPGTLERPFRSIQKALNTVKSGRIYVRGGLYAERLTWQYSAPAGDTLVLAAYSKNEPVQVDGNSQGTGNSALLRIVDKSNILIQDITFQNNIGPDVQGIFISGSGTNVTIRNCSITQIGWTSNPLLIPGDANNAHGILILGNQAQPYTKINVEHSTITRCQMGRSEALTITGNVDGFRIEHNSINNITNIGIDAAGHYSWANSSPAVNQVRNGIIRANTVFACLFPGNQVATAGIYADGSRDIVIERNRCFNNSVGISVGCENPNKTASNIIVRSNFIYHNLSCGVYWGANATGSRIEKCRFYNNTLFYNASDEGWRGEIHLQNSYLSELFQNIIATRKGKKALITLEGFKLESPALGHNLYHNEANDPNAMEFDWNGNLYTSLGSFQQVIQVDSESFFANPQFLSTNPNSLDLHIAASSGARDACSSAYFPSQGELDIDGQPRRSGVLADVGADEIPAMSVGLSGTSPDLLVKIFPNPVSSQLFVTELPINVSSLTLINALGQTLKTFNSVNDQMKIDVQNLPSGVYYIWIHTPDKSILHPILKQ